MAYHNIFQHRHLGKEPDILESAGDAELGDFVGWFAGNIFAQKDYLALVRPEKAANQVYDGGFTGAVRPDQALNATRRECKTHLVYRFYPAKDPPDIAQF